MTVATGLSKVFNYPRELKSLPDYTARSGRNVTVMRPLTEDEADGPNQGCEQMYRIRDESDGWEGDAFESELS